MVCIRSTLHRQSETLTMPDFFEVVNERHSCRHFSHQPVPSQLLEKIVQTANRAPSAGIRRIGE